MNESAETIRRISALLLDNRITEAGTVISSEYPHNVKGNVRRSYSTAEKIEQFIRDGFIDRYNGRKLVNPGILRVISKYLPDEFPYHPHWKMSETHPAYWELTPTIDHIYPIALGGSDIPENRATASMKNNMIKSGYTLQELGWTLHPAGSLDDWDGLSCVFCKLVENDTALLADAYIKNWYDDTRILLKKEAFESGSHD